MPKSSPCGAFLFLFFSACASRAGYSPADGDVIFHASRSSQSRAVQLATRSRYSHMGIVYLKGGQAFVFEAVGPVKLTPLQEWTARGEGGRFVVKRLADAKRILTPEGLRRMREAGKRHEGKRYDLYFEWSDDRIYCSELVWKVFKQAFDIEVGKLQKMSEFDFSHPAVRAKIKERFGDSIPGDEIVISPRAIFESDRLTPMPLT